MVKAAEDYIFVGTINKLRMVDMPVHKKGNHVSEPTSFIFFFFFSDEINRLVQIIEAVLQG